ncbi:DMT family transporter [Limnoglobus roseus]|uniref:Guanidinium exporter n=1 Tax=Limnoglobus roseus TaxID=2598579 RepID=A0A5C1ARM5_9BACT|nr:multidrug efflux SMR transporter [Limnoglobus roseus]QEL20807.1 quaternary ammonium compound-resistance protein SugE [Limnoglobus roseus]
MGWVYLLLAGMLELGWPVSIKFAWADDRLRVGPASAAVVCMLGSMGLLLLAQRTIPIGTAYAVWTGIGAAGTAALGMLILDEPATVLRVVFLSLIVAGVAGLKFTG